MWKSQETSFYCNGFGWKKVFCCSTELIMPKREKVSRNELWKLKWLVNILGQVFFRTLFPLLPIGTIAYLECYFQFVCPAFDGFNFNQISYSTRDILARNDQIIKLDFVAKIDEFWQQNIMFCVLSWWLFIIITIEWKREIERITDWFVNCQWNDVTEEKWVKKIQGKWNATIQLKTNNMYYFQMAFGMSYACWLGTHSQSHPFNKRYNPMYI